MTQRCDFFPVVNRYFQSLPGQASAEGGNMGGLLDPLTSICLTTPSCLPNDLALVFTRLRRRGRAFLCSSDGRSPSTSSSISSILLSNSSSSSLVVRGSHLSVSDGRSPSTSSSISSILLSNSSSSSL